MEIETLSPSESIYTNIPNTTVINGHNLQENSNTFSNNYTEHSDTDQNNYLNFTKNSVSSSIIVYPEEDGDSSCIDSDSNYEVTITSEITDNTKSELNSRSSSTEIVAIDNHQQSIAENIESNNSNLDTNIGIGSIGLQNSAHITIGNKSFYRGPVTIKQFLLDKKNSKENENHNPAYKRNTVENDITTISSMTMTNKLDEDCFTRKTIANCNKERKIGSRVSYAKKSLSIITMCVIIGLIAVTVIATATDIFGKKYERTDFVEMENNDTEFQTVSRTEWKALPPKSELNDLVLPSERVIIAHTASEHCITLFTCSDKMRNIQEFHIETEKMDDISYNFLVGGDGAAYEGRGWNKEGNHTSGFNNGSICISFIGSFTNIDPPQEQLLAAVFLIQQGIRLKKLIPNYRLYGHSQLKSTKSPGKKLFEIINKWPHWSLKVF